MPKFSLSRARSHASSMVLALMTSAVTLSVSLSPVFAQANPDAGQGNFFFFGDSATGQGNWSAIVGNRGDDHFPYSSNNGFARETNGLIWTEMLGRDVDIILDPDADSSNINFAISGAHMTRGGDLVPFGIETGVLTQTELFGNLVANEAIAVGGNDVAFILAGGNDFLDRLEIDDPADEIMADVASAAAENVSALAEAGVKTIILSEMQPLQYAPQYADAPEVQAALSDLVADTNAAMIAAVEAAGLSDDVNVVTMKYVDMVAYMARNADLLGFEDISGSCYDPDTEELCSADKDVQDTYLFLDDLHFTERAQRIEAQWFLATLAGANGQASRQSARVPRTVYEERERHARQFAPGAQTSSDKAFAVWLSPISSSHELKSGEGDLDADVDFDGAALGLEKRLAQRYILGGALTVGKTEADFADNGGYDLEGGALSVYAAADFAEFGRFGLTLTGGGYEVKDISRHTGVDFLSATGETEAEYWEVSLSSRSTDLVGAFQIDHGVTLTTGRIEVDGYAEDDADGLAITYADQSFRYHLAEIDTSIKGPAWVISDEIRLRPLVKVAYAHQFGDEDYRVTSQLTGNSAAPVSIRSAAPTEDRVDAGFGAELSIGRRWAVSGRYARRWSSDLDQSDEAAVSLRATF